MVALFLNKISNILCILYTDPTPFWVSLHRRRLAITSLRLAEAPETPISGPDPFPSLNYLQGNNYLHLLYLLLRSGYLAHIYTMCDVYCPKGAIIFIQFGAEITMYTLASAILRKMNTKEREQQSQLVSVLMTFSGITLTREGLTRTIMNGSTVCNLLYTFRHRPVLFNTFQE